MSGKKRFFGLGMLDVYLIVDFIILIIFTIANMIVFCIVGSVPDTLVASFFASFGAENGFLALIMIVKKFTEKGESNSEFEEGE